ncbi:hypothetical protein CYMTET_6381 [Cymbomonas tetramitiformis]|uniref:EGF-like domain-containing protein n=1 Tax=Cymbomonas tetramitiformis TaxID=36881 RepID=A0AAE0GXJ5_9CHLO|nr:hypothetical protein CYMTET_6381 [Cymbomonas tetramitiformis]
MFEDLALSDLLSDPVAYDNFTSEFTWSIALHAGVEMEYVQIDSITSGSVHVHSTIRWTEAHLANGASPDAFISQATADAASLFAESASLSTHGVTAAAPIMASGVMSVATPGFPPLPPSPPPMCELLEPCFPGVMCISDPAQPLGYRCGPCPEGMTGSGEDCMDVDECAVGMQASEDASANTTRPCDPLTQCMNHPGGFWCSACPAGYTNSRSPDGITVCLDINECHTANGGCDFLTNCVNHLGSSMCGDCPAGYSGDGESGCYDVDECSAPDRGGCAPQAKCVNLKGGSTCGECEPAEYFNGDGYDCRLVQTCAENNGGCDDLVECSEDAEGSRPSCGPCPEGMSGTGATKCSEIDGCAREPCFEGVGCTDVPAPGVGAVCGECPEGFTGNGRTCEVDLCAASPPPCSVAPRVTCTNLFIKASVACGPCPAGSIGGGSVCTDVDECAVNNGGCHYLTKCKNEEGRRPTCGTCPEGYAGSGYTGCRVQVACDVENGGCDRLVSCTDSAVDGGTPTCGSCPEGYRGDGVMGCEEIDGCEESPCYPGVHCEDIPAPGEDGVHVGGYACGACPTHMVGDGKTCMDNMCSSSYISGDCDPMVECTNDVDTPGGFVCGACPVGFTDEHTGRDGTKCEDEDGCLDEPCAPEQECVDVPGQKVLTLGAQHSCGPCPAGYLAVGERCEDLDECAVANGGCWMTADGSVNALCVNEPGGRSCGACPAGLRGSGLTGCVPTTDCSENNGGCWVGTDADLGFAAACEQTELGSVCGECPDGFVGDGDTGCQDLDACASLPCFPGVECSDLPAPALADGYTCASCPEGYRGDGESCTLCKMMMSILYTTAVNGIVKRAGWHRGERALIGGHNQGLDDEECVNELGMQFWWSAAASDGSVFPLDADTNKALTLVLSVPKASLVVDLTYTFKLSAALVGNPQVVAEAKSSFFVQSQPLVLVIRGGEVATGESSPITLDASESLDPDGEERAITFTWRCYIASGGGDCRLANGTMLPTTMTGPSLQLTLTAGGATINYTFALTGTKGARTSVALTRINITRGSPPVPQITPLLEKANPGQKLRLQSSVAAVDTEQLRYEWTVLAGESTHELDLEESLASVSRFQASIVLQPGVLAPGGEYTFQLEAEDSIGLATVQMKVQVNAPPAGGYADVNPSDGEAYVDVFSLSAPGWRDEDAPLWYQYSFRVVGLEASLVTLSNYAPLPGPAYAITTMIPGEGLEEQGHVVTAVVSIQDALGATAFAERNLTVRPPNADGVSALTASLVSGAARALREGDTDGAAVQIDGAAALLNAAAVAAADAELMSASPVSLTNATWRRQRLSNLNSTAARSALRGELVADLGAMRTALFSTGPSVERLARSVSSLTAVPAELTSETQERSMTLLTGLVEDTRADPVAAPLTETAAQAVCGGLAALNQAPARPEPTSEEFAEGRNESDARNATEGSGTLAETRASEVANTMGLMARSMLDGFVPGEPGPEVVADGLAMKVERNEVSNPDSTLYTVPLVTAGATVAFPAVLASILSPASPDACNLTIEGTVGCFTTARTAAVDTQLLVSAVDPYSLTPDPRATVTSGVTTIEMRAVGVEGEELKVAGLSEALVFSIELGPASEGAPDGDEDGGGTRVRCAYWNVTRGEYVSDGCTQLPNPAPAGSYVYWKTRMVTELENEELDRAWAIAELGNLTSGCAETFNATWPEYNGSDAGLRKYVAEVHGHICQLSLEGNAWGCWWNWTHQIFSGPLCMMSEVQQCYCTHLTEFKAVQDMEVGSVEPPKIKTLSTTQMTSLSAQDVLESAVLLTLAGSIMAVAVYLAACSSNIHTEQRKALLQNLVRPRGTGRFAFKFQKSAWTWTLFEEDREDARVEVMSLHQKRLQRNQHMKKEKLPLRARLAQHGLHAERTRMRAMAPTPAVRWKSAIRNTLSMVHEEQVMLKERWEPISKHSPFPRPARSHTWELGAECPDYFRVQRMQVEGTERHPAAVSGSFPAPASEYDWAFQVPPRYMPETRCLIHLFGSRAADGNTGEDSSVLLSDCAPRKAKKRGVGTTRRVRARSTAPTDSAETVAGTAILEVSTEAIEAESNGRAVTSLHATPGADLGAHAAGKSQGPAPSAGPVLESLVRDKSNRKLKKKHDAITMRAVEVMPQRELVLEVEEKGACEAVAQARGQAMPLQASRLTRELQHHNDTAPVVVRVTDGARVAFTPPRETLMRVNPRGRRFRHRGLEVPEMHRKPTHADRKDPPPHDRMGNPLEVTQDIEHFASGTGHGRHDLTRPSSDELRPSPHKTKRHEPAYRDMIATQDVSGASPLGPEATSTKLRRHTNVIEKKKKKKKKKPRLEIPSADEGPVSPALCAPNPPPFQHNFHAPSLGSALPDASASAGGRLARVSTFMNALTLHPPRSPQTIQTSLSEHLLDVEWVTERKAAVSTEGEGRPPEVTQRDTGSEVKEVWINHEIDLSARVALQLGPMVGFKTAQRLAESYVRKLKTKQAVTKRRRNLLKHASPLLQMAAKLKARAPGDSNSTPRCLDQDDGTPLKPVDSALISRLRTRLRAAIVMIQILQRIQDLKHSQHLCSLLNLTLTAMQLRIPVLELRLMYEKGNLAAYDEELVAKNGVKKRWKKVSMLTKLAHQTSLKQESNMKQDNAATTPMPVISMKTAATSEKNSDDTFSVERMLGTTVVMAYLEVTRTVKPKQMQQQRLMEFKAGMYDKYLSAFRVMMSTIHKTSGWYYRTLMWNIIFLQKPNGSFDISPSLATVLFAGDSSPILVNPTKLLDDHHLRMSTPARLMEACDEADEAYTLWATLCVIERLKKLPFVWVINPTAIPEERCTVASLAREYINTQLTQERATFVRDLQREAKEAVDGWISQRILAVKGLRWQVQMAKSAMVIHQENTLFATPKLSSKEQWDLRIQQFKKLGMAALRNHPWCKIAVVKKDEVYTRAQRILNQCNGILLMLMCCLWFYYSKAATCCQEFRTRIGCVADTTVECLGHSACYTLMASEPYSCEGFTCAALDDSDTPDGYSSLPGGYTCSAFPKDTYTDKAMMAVLITAIIMPVNLSFMAMFTAGGTYQIPNHWEGNAKIKADKMIGRRGLLFLENLVFLFYTLFFDQIHLSRAMARYFSMVLLALDGVFNGLRIASRRVSELYVNLSVGMYFLYQTRVKKRSPNVVFMELQVTMKLRRANVLREGMHEKIFQQAQHEFDNGWVQLSFVLLFMGWVVIVIVLLVYANLIRDLMGRRAENRVLEAWIIALLIDNLGMQVLKSLTIKVWLKAMIRKLKPVGNQEVKMAAWFEEYINANLPSAYTSSLVEEEEDREIEYDVAGITI